MTGMEVPVSGAVLILVGKILVGTQFLKKMIERIPFVATWLGAEYSVWLSVALTAVVALAAGVLQYGGDGGVSLAEWVEIGKALVAAMGGFELFKSWFGGKSDS